MLELDKKALDVAARQSWVLTRDEAFELGFTDKMISHRLKREVWEMIRKGCYLVAPVQAEPRIYLEAAIHSLRGAVVTHESAAELHGLNYVPRGLAVVSVPPKTTHSFPGVVVRRPKDLIEDHVEEKEGLPVTTVIRTAFDLSGIYAYGRVERMLDDAIVAKNFDLESYRAFAEALLGRGKPGSSINRRYLAERGTGFVAPTTELERLVFGLIRKGGLPEPERQVSLPFYVPVPGVCDFLYRWAKLILEADGRRWHTLLADFENDRKRDNEAMRNNYRVLRLTYEMLTKNPAGVIELIRDTLALADRS